MAGAASLSPSEVCKALGVSAKALRLYEQRGLVNPRRTSAGWRVFGPDDVARLHQIKLLKGLGLSLEQIGDLLNSRLADLGAFLEMQAAALAAEVQRLGRARGLIQRARDTLAQGQALSIADIIALSQESPAMPRSDWFEFARPFYERHLTAQDNRVSGERIRARWSGMFEEANTLFTASVDPLSAEVLDLTRRWLDLSDLLSDAERQKKSGAAYMEALADPEVAPHLPLSREVLAFLAPAFARHRSKDG